MKSNTFEIRSKVLNAKSFDCALQQMKTVQSFQYVVEIPIVNYMKINENKFLKVEFHETLDFQIFLHHHSNDSNRLN